MSNMLIINMLTNPSALRYHLRIMFFAWMGWKKSLRCVIRTVTRMRTLYLSVCVSAMSLVLDSECDSACHALSWWHHWEAETDRGEDLLAPEAGDLSCDLSLPNWHRSLTGPLGSSSASRWSTCTQTDTHSFRVIARDLCCLFSWEKLAVFLSRSQKNRDLAISVYYSCLSASPNCMLRAFACPMRGNSTGVHFCGGWKCRGRPERRSGSEHSRVSFFCAWGPACMALFFCFDSRW